jgi:hypothetical protein
MEAFRKMGINPEEIIRVGADEITGYAESVPITATSNYPTGALLQDKKTGGVYWVDAGTKAPIWDKVLLQTKFKNKKIIKASAAQLAAYPTVDPVRLNDGDIVRTPLNPAVFIIENGLKRLVTSAEAFSALGYKWSNVLVVSEKLLSLHQEGQIISKEQ